MNVTKKKFLSALPIPSINVSFGHVLFLFRSCELCSQEYVIEPVYAEGTPDRLSQAQLLWGFLSLSLLSLMTGLAIVLIFLRTILVFTMWFVLLPLMTTVFGQFFFMRMAHLLSVASELALKTPNALQVTLVCVCCSPPIFLM